MRDGEVLLVTITFVDGAVHTAADGVGFARLLQLSIVPDFECRDRARRGRVSGPIFGVTVDSFLLGVKGQPAGHLTACLEGLTESEGSAFQVQPVDVAIIVRCP